MDGVRAEAFCSARLRAAGHLLAVHRIKMDNEVLELLKASVFYRGGGGGAARWIYLSGVRSIEDITWASGLCVWFGGGVYRLGASFRVEAGAYTCANNSHRKDEPNCGPFLGR